MVTDRQLESSSWICKPVVELRVKSFLLNFVDVIGRVNDEGQWVGGDQDDEWSRSQVDRSPILEER